MGMKDTVTFAIKLRHKGGGTTTACANYYGPVLPRHIDFNEGRNRVGKPVQISSG